MDVLILAGFLGSGKTTLLLALAKRWIAEGKRIAIIENEVGAVGVDGIRVAAEGLAVREIVAGCICCTLTGDLIAAVNEIRTSFSPDLLILEPSGVASPRQVVEVFDGMDGIGSRLIAVLVDGARWHLLKNKAASFIRGSLAVADVALLTKTDALSPSAIHSALAEVTALRHGLSVYPVSARTGAGMEELFAGLTAPASYRSICAVDDAKSDVDPISAIRFRGGVYARSIDISLGEAMSPEAVANWLLDAMEALGRAIRACCDIEPLGHLKTALQTEDGSLFANLERFDHPARLTGTLAGSIRTMRMTVNAIVQEADAHALRQHLDPVISHFTCMTCQPVQGYRI
jgi:G3E family GTPase